MKKSAKVSMINHVMAKQLVRSEHGFIVEEPIVDFVGIGVSNVFHTLDHFLCSRGKHSIFMRIVHVDSGNIVQGIEPFVVETADDNYTYSYTVGWSYEAVLPGIYEYQIWANSKPIGTFRFVQHQG